MLWGWQAIASIRKFDLRYGQEIQTLFQGTPLKPPEPDCEFSQTCHLNIHLLNDQELSQVQSQSSDLNELLDRASDLPNLCLLDLLRNPFNLRLAASLIAKGVTIDDIAPVQSRIDLLELYWQKRVNVGPNGHARERVCKILCKEMVKHQSLQADVSSVPLDASTALHQLKVDGVVNEWQIHPSARPDQSILAYSHNVLFDYATARTLLRGTGNKVKDLMIADPNIVLTIRPSFEMHFQYLWGYNKSRFWEHVLDVQGDDVPKIGQLIGPAVAAELALAPEDLGPLIDSLDSQNTNIRSAAETAVLHITGSLLATRSDYELASSAVWTSWIRQISDRISPDTATAVRALLIAICEGMKDDPRLKD